MAFVALTASSYYLTPILVQLGSGLPEIQISENESEVLYILPYRFHIFYTVEDMRTYVLTYALQLPFVFVSGFGQSAADCIMVTLVFHICGQMSVLALRINNIDTDPYNCSKELRNVIRSHIRLLRYYELRMLWSFAPLSPLPHFIRTFYSSRRTLHNSWFYLSALYFTSEFSLLDSCRMGKAVKKAFSITLLAHLFGATSLVCILGYQILTNFANGEKTILITFVTFQFLVLLILYAHCTVGESLLTESAKVSEALYDCKWYNMPIKNARCVVLCIMRAQKPLCLTAGKFSIFCLSTLTDVLKTSMGYLSVLRSFL